MFITLFLLAFALCLCFVPEHQVNVIRTWYLGTIQDFVLSVSVCTCVCLCVYVWVCRTYSTTVRSNTKIGYYVMNCVYVSIGIMVYAYLSCDTVYADPLDSVDYIARYCKPENHGIDLDNPVTRRWVHWSDWSHLITPYALDYINSLGKVASNYDLFMPGCPIAAAIWGLMLSDGCVLSNNKTTDLNSYFRLHLKTCERSAAYVAVTACFLETVSLGHGIIRTSSDNGKVNLVTRSYQELRWSHVSDKLYNSYRVKVMPLNVQDYMSTFGLALAIMGDGMARGKAMSICVNNFSKVEANYLSKAMFNLYGIQTTVQGTKYPDLYFQVKSMPKVRQLIQPYLHKSWYYKISA